METEGSLPHSQASALVPILSQHDPVHNPHILLPEDPSEYYPPIYAYVSQVVSFPQVSPPKPYIRLFSYPYALRAPPISFFSISSPKQWTAGILIQNNCRTNKSWFFYKDQSLFKYSCCLIWQKNVRRKHSHITNREWGSIFLSFFVLWPTNAQLFHKLSHHYILYCDQQMHNYFTNYLTITFCTVTNKCTIISQIITPLRFELWPTNAQLFHKLSHFFHISIKVYGIPYGLTIWHFTYQPFYVTVN